LILQSAHMMESEDWTVNPTLSMIQWIPTSLLSMLTLLFSMWEYTLLPSIQTTTCCMSMMKQLERLSQNLSIGRVEFLVLKH